jgi:hypothetical protein
MRSAAEAEPPKNPKKAKRPFYKSRRLLWALAIPLLLVAIAPYVLARQPLRNWFLTLLAGDVDGHVTASGARFGWFSPVAIYDLEVHPASGPPLLTVARCEGDTPLWRLMLRPSQIGHMEIDHPQVRIVVDENRQSNLAGFLKPLQKANQNRADEPQDQAAPAEVPNLALMISVSGGSFAFRGSPEAQEWMLGSLNITGGLRPARIEGGPPELIIEPGRVIDHVEITPEICNDLLKFAAPVLADVARAQGSFTVELEQFQMPLGQPKAGEMRGTLSIHLVDVGAGPMTRMLTEVFGLPQTLRLADENEIRFSMEQGRVYHENLEFYLGTMRLRTSGYVGMDQSLDLVAKITLPELDIEAPALRQMFSGRQIEIPIRGTLDKPVLTGEAAQKEGTEMLLTLIQELLDGDGANLSDLAERLRARGWRRNAEASQGAVEAGAAEAGPVEGILENRAGLERLFGGRTWWRRQGDQEPVPNAESSNPNDTDSETTPRADEGESDGPDATGEDSQPGPLRRFFDSRRRRRGQTP